jgi:hypothetical protein
VTPAANLRLVSTMPAAECRQCKRHRRQICGWCQQRQRQSAASVSDTGGNVQGEPNLETCENDISPKPYSRLTIPPPPSHMPKNKAIQLYINMTHRRRVNTHKGKYKWRWIQTICEYMNTYEYEYNTVETYEPSVLRIGLLDSDLVQLKEKNRIFYTLSHGRIK